MKRLALFSVAVAAMAIVAAVMPEANAQKEKDALQLELKLLDGLWQLVSQEVDGQKRDVQLVVKVTVKDGKYAVQVGDKVVEEGSFRIDPRTKPKSIDSLPESGERKGKTILAVYDVAGDDLRLCVAPEGSNRPQELASKQGTGHILNTYKRQPSPK